jgi:glutamine phosphoribosylpyrophosphate amidotransferase
LDQPTPIEKDNPLGMSARASYSDYWPTTSSKDKPHDECGVFGIHAPGQDVANVTYFGLYALQHRGQESAGITVSYGERLETIKDMGLVSQVFDDPHVLGNLRGNLALGHTRYSTTGSAKVLNAQPMVYDHPQIGPVAIGHNPPPGVRGEGRRVRAGSWSGCLHRHDGRRHRVASETCALDPVRAKYVRDVEPGEVVIINDKGNDGEYPVSVPIQLEMDRLSLEPKVRAEPAGRSGA